MKRSASRIASLASHYLRATCNKRSEILPVNLMLLENRTYITSNPVNNIMWSTALRESRRGGLSTHLSFTSANSSHPGNSDPENSKDVKDEQKIEEASDSESAEIESLMSALAEKDVELEEKKSEIEKLKDGVLRSYAEMENLRERTRREIESTRKFSVQGFAKDLLDVGDNLSRAVSVVPEEYRNEVPQNTSSGSVDVSRKLLKSLLEGVLMTEQQLMKVFRKHGLERFDPTGEVFDPNLHNALFEVSDAKKPPGTVAVVTSVGYKLHDRVIRPAEVGVVKAPE